MGRGEKPGDEMRGRRGAVSITPLSWVSLCGLIGVSFTAGGNSAALQQTRCPFCTHACNTGSFIACTQPDALRSVHPSGFQSVEFIAPFHLSSEIGPVVFLNLHLPQWCPVSKAKEGWAQWEFLFVWVGIRSKKKKKPPLKWRFRWYVLICSS